MQNTTRRNTSHEYCELGSLKKGQRFSFPDQTNLVCEVVENLMDPKIPAVLIRELNDLPIQGARTIRPDEMVIRV